MSEASSFWDIMGPIGFALFGICFVLSIWGYRKHSAMVVFMCSLVSGVTAYIMMWSFGLIIGIVAVLQLLAAFYLYRKPRESKERVDN
ncbi:hypothetical protein [Salinithrix halophila]|uniref:Inner membrane protein n=1 Tax=Salinithrix halophila TaxID=1485204 RepID=A0ABV8J9R8_9BACL